MAHRTVADIGDDFHVRVSMWRETAVRRDFIIVPNAQRAPAGIGISWGEMTLGLEPIALITRKRLKEPAFDHDLALRELCSVSWLQCLSLKTETFETFGF